MTLSTGWLTRPCLSFSLARRTKSKKGIMQLSRSHEFMYNNNTYAYTLFPLRPPLPLVENHTPLAMYHNENFACSGLVSTWGKYRSRSIE